MSMHILLKRIKSLIMSITFIGVVVHQHPRLFCFSMENFSFFHSRRFFCGCFDIMNKNDAYEYRPGFAGERYV